MASSALFFQLGIGIHLSKNLRPGTASRYHEKKLGQLFCNKSARLIVEMLRQELIMVLLTIA